MSSNEHLLFGGIKKVTEKIIEDGDNWTKDRENAWEYFMLFDEAEKRIKEYVRSFSENRKKFVHLDIGGRAKLNSFEGSQNKTYSFSLMRKGNLDTEEIEFTEGDLFKTHDFDKFIDYVRDKEGKVQFVTLNTVGGLQGYDPITIQNKTGIIAKKIEKIFANLLFRRLKKISQIVETGGYVLIGSNSFLDFYIQNNYDFFKSLFKRSGFSVELTSDKNPKYSFKFLLKKD